MLILVHPIKYEETTLVLNSGTTVRETVILSLLGITAVVTCIRNMEDIV